MFEMTHLWVCMKVVTKKKEDGAEYDNFKSN